MLKHFHRLFLVLYLFIITYSLFFFLSSWGGMAIKRVRLSPTGDSLTQQHFTFHDGEKKDYSSQSSCIISKKVCPEGHTLFNYYYSN